MKDGKFPNAFYAGGPHGPPDFFVRKNVD